MKDSKLEFNTPDDVEAVFYESFRHCDAGVMAALWADGDVVCIHPGSGVIAGYEAVTRSWRHIFIDAEQANLQYKVLSKYHSDDLAVHLVSEELTAGGETVLVLATNVYQKQASGWLMVEHHGSTVQLRPQNETVQ